MTRNKTLCTLILACWSFSVDSGWSGESEAASEEVKRLEQFTLPDVDGTEITYEPGKGGVSILVFLAAHQKQSEQALKDLEKIVAELDEQEQRIALNAVINGTEDKDYLDGLGKDRKLDFPLLLDRDYEVWERLGIIASPTVIVVGPDAEIRWKNAGYGLDYSRKVLRHVEKALGLRQGRRTYKPRGVVTGDGKAEQEQGLGHLRMARLLAGKGRFDEAISELKTAAALSPESVEMQLELGAILCRAGRGKEALDAVKKIQVARREDTARVKTVEGWAHRQLGELDLAEELLKEAVLIDRKSVRALFELGRVYKEQGKKEQALDAYERALAAHLQEDLLPLPVKGSEQ